MSAIKGPITESLKRHADNAAAVRTEKPASFTVGAYTDGHKGTVGVTYDRKWWNGWGATAYARAWWTDAQVIPNTPQYGGEVGVEGRYEFEPPR